MYECSQEMNNEKQISSCGLIDGDNYKIISTGLGEQLVTREESRLLTDAQLWNSSSHSLRLYTQTSCQDPCDYVSSCGRVHLGLRDRVIGPELRYQVHHRLQYHRHFQTSCFDDADSQLRTRPWVSHSDHHDP